MTRAIGLTGILPRLPRRRGFRRSRCRTCGSPRLVRHPEIQHSRHRPCRLRRLLRHDREARRPFAGRQAADHRRRNPRRGLDLPATSRALMACVRRCRCSRRCSCARTRSSSGPTWRNTRRSAGQVRTLMRDLTPLVEPVSIDEAFLDLSGTERLHGRTAAPIARPLCARSRTTIGHHRFDRAVLQQVSGENRLRPRQTARLCSARPRRSAAFLAGKPVSIIFGIGKVAQERLARDGYPHHCRPAESG